MTIDKDLFDERYYLHYVDYRDSFEHRLEEVEQAIREKSWQPLDEIFDDPDWGYPDAEAIDEVAERWMEKYGKTEEERDAWREENHDEIVYGIEERDCSTPLDDMLRNTGSIACFYELPNWDGLGETWGMDEREQKEAIAQMRKCLGIKVRSKDFEKELYELLINASYGGTLVVYFNPDIKEFIQTDGNMIRFTDPHVALIDTYNGSGHDVQLVGHSLEIPYDSEKFFVCANIKYSYTHRVCGMSNTWCSGTDVSLRKARLRKPAEKGASVLQREREWDKHYAERFKQGKCSFGDMDMKRHRRTVYINYFPCGTRCKDCGTFWID